MCAEGATKQEVVLTWTFRAIEDFFFAFQHEYPCRFGPFFEAMGLEMILKSYFLAEQASKFEGLPEKEQKFKINKIAKGLGHNLDDLIERADKSISAAGLKELLAQDFDGYTGKQMLEALEAAYIECRYPVPDPLHRKHPLCDRDGRQIKGSYRDPIYSSGTAKFAYAVARIVLGLIRKEHGVALDRQYLRQLLARDDGRRFCNLFFGGEIDRFIGEEKDDGIDCS
jgi:hypothetical protein